MPSNVKKDSTDKHDTKKSARKDIPLNWQSQPDFKEPLKSRASPDERKVQRAARHMGVNLNRKGPPTRLSEKQDEALKHAVTLINNNNHNNFSDNDLLQKAMRHAALEQKNPPTKVGQKTIFNGSRRGFEPDFSDAFWKKHTGTKCPKCQQILTRKNGEIDHRKSWSERQHFADPIQICFQQKHWEVVLVDDMFKEYQDISNLQPMCKSCNASKNGMKGNDLAIPRIIGNCDGNCDLPKDCK